MTTNLSLDPELLERALRVSGEKTKKAALTKALKEFVARHEQHESPSFWRTRLGFLVRLQEGQIEEVNVLGDTSV